MGEKILSWFAHITFKQAVVFFCVALIVCICLVLRFEAYALTPGFYHPDAKRDFIIGHQMITYGEIPMTGPNGEFGSEINSPFYYYLLAAIMFVFGDSILSLLIANLLLNIGYVVPLFILVRNFFNLRAAFIAAIFYTFFNVFVVQAIFIWQPYIMELFVLLSLLSLSYAYTQKKNIFVYLALILFACGGVVHNALLMLTPVFLIACIVSLHKVKSVAQRITAVLLVFFVSELLLFAPVLWYHLFDPHSNFKHTSLSSVFDPTHALVLGLERFNAFLMQNFFVHLSSGYVYVLYGAFILGLIIYAVKHRTQKELVICAVFVGSIISSVLVLGSIVKLFPYDPVFPSRYFTPIEIPLVVMVAALLASLSYQKKIGIPLVACLVIILVHCCSYVSVSDIDIFSNPSNFLSRVFSPRLLEYEPSAEGIAVYHYILSHHLEGNYDLSVVYATGKSYNIDFSNDELWEPLLFLSSGKLLVLDDASPKGYRPVQSNRNNLFLKYQPFTSNADMSNFIKQYYPGYRIVDLLFTNQQKGTVIYFLQSA